MTELCELAYKYGTDKTPQIKHPYTPYYYELLKDKRQSIKKVLEMGIGCYEGIKHRDTIYDPVLKRRYRKGASLKMWRDFFPNAQIYGADIEPDTMFKDKRIVTFLCDETKKGDLTKLIEKTGSDIDLFIDDGLHTRKAQLFLCQTIMPLLKKDVIYIIEDVSSAHYIKKKLKYGCHIPKISKKWHDSCLMIVKND